MAYSYHKRPSVSVREPESGEWRDKDKGGKAQTTTVVCVTNLDRVLVLLLHVIFQLTHDTVQASKSHVTREGCGAGAGAAVVLSLTSLVGT